MTWQGPGSNCNLLDDHEWITIEYKNFKDPQETTWSDRTITEEGSETTSI